MKKDFPTWSALECAAQFRLEKAALPDVGPRYAVIPMPPYYDPFGNFWEATNYVVDRANDCRVVGSSPDASGQTSAYSMAARMNEQDQSERLDG